MAGGSVASVWLGTPCSSWSRAHRGPPDSAWPPLRDTFNPLGRPNLRAADRARVADGSRLMKFTAQVIRRAVALNIPVALENPHDSFLWQAPPIACLVSQRGCHIHVFGQWQVGTRWRKRASVASWGCSHSPALSKV